MSGSNGVDTNVKIESVEHGHETITAMILSDGLEVQDGQLEFHLSSEENGYLKSKKQMKDKTCEVCGDKALGHNFGAISCESCKAFFRRNALKNKESKCIKNENCEIDMITRRFCPFCRLQKCFRIGMKKELILDDESRKRRQQKVNTNRAKKVKEGHDGGDLSFNSVECSPASLFTASPAAHTEIVTSEGGCVDGGAAAQLAGLAPASPAALPTAALPVSPASAAPPGTYEVTVTSSYDVTPSTTLSSEELPIQLPVGVTIGSVLGQHMQLYVQRGGPGAISQPTMNLLSLPSLAPAAPLAETENDSDKNSKRRLTHEETSMLTELQHVYDLSFTTDLEPLVHVKAIDPTLNQLVNQSSITVMRFIKFAKKLEEFAQLPQECQIGILKGTWIHNLLIRSISLYDGARDVWVTPRGQIPTEILKNATGFDQLHDAHVNYCKSMRSLIGDDIMIVIVLLVTVLFSPDGAHLTSRDMVSNIQDKYLVLLKHYLESRLGYSQAAVRYSELMSKLRELKELADVHGQYLLNVNPREIEPIMLEILDLK